MTGRVLPARKSQILRYVSYTVDQGILLSANSLVNPIEFASSRRRESAVLEVGRQHPICQALNKIQLARYPFAYQFSPRNEMILFPGRNVRDV